MQDARRAYRKLDLVQGPVRQTGVSIVLALLLGTSALAQATGPVLLETPSGSLSISGHLLDYQAGTYTVATGLGDLTLNGAALTCSGPACPEDSPAPVVRPVGDSPKTGVTVRSLSGAVQLNGFVLARDSGSITLATVAGTVTVPSARVICEGTGCPDRTWPGLAEARADMTAGKVFDPDEATNIADTGSIGAPPAPEADIASVEAVSDAPDANALAAEDTLAENTAEPEASDQVVIAGAEFVLAPLRPVLSSAFADDTSAKLVVQSLDTGTTDLPAAGTADAVIRPQPLGGSEAGTVIGYDALVPLVHPDNPLPQLSTAQLRAILAGKVTDWADLGGAAGPITLVGLPAKNPLSDLRDTLLPPTDGNEGAAPQVQVETVAVLAEEVALDPAAIGLGTLSQRGPARAVPLTSACGHGVPADASTIRTGAYPLAYSIVLAPSPRGDAATTAVERMLAPGTLDGSALIPVGMKPGPLDALRARLTDMLDGGGDAELRSALKAALRNAGAARQLPFVIRFDGDSNRLAPGSEDALAAVAELAGGGGFPELFLVGHAENTGDPEHSRTLSRLAARLVRQVMTRADQDGQLSDTVIRTVGLGALAPERCGPDASDSANRRVEIWVRG